MLCIVFIDYLLTDDDEEEDDGLLFLGSDDGDEYGALGE